jgi:hypothetical protein
LRTALEEFPLAVGVEEGVAYLETCATCIVQAQDLLAEPRIPFSAAHLLITQMRQCSSTQLQTKARLLSSVQAELMQHISALEGLLQSERPHQEEAMRFLRQRPSCDVSGGQAIERLLADGGCMQLLQSLEQSRVVRAPPNARCCHC